MRVFLDTNVVIDFVGHREPFFAAPAGIIDMVIREEITLLISSLSFINAAYILRRLLGKEITSRKLVQLSAISEISYIDGHIIKDALRRNTHDFEDCVQYLSALQGEADVIVTRDKTGFEDLDGIILTPEEFLEKCRM